jgi:hypothetical protein
MKAASLLLGALVLSVAAPAPADFTKLETFEYSGKTSIKVLDPTGAKVTVGSEVDTVPHIFTLPDQDAFVPVKVVAADGEVWNGKIEVKARKQTVIHLTQVAKPAAAPAAPTAAPAAKHRFVGHLKNTSKSCRASDRVNLFVFVKDGAEVKRVPAEAGTATVELEEGDYTVRAFQGDNFVRTFKKTISADNWVVNIGC